MTKWMQDVSKEIERKGTEGAFTKQAKSRGMETQEFASQVLRNKEQYPTKTVRRANLARTFNKAAQRHSPRTTVDVCGKTVTLNTGTPANWPNNTAKPPNNARIWPPGGRKNVG